jgi:predicted AlkP superfamily phosphohydrolase/phosphomutase
MNARKVMLIGLDGADWRLLEPWLQQGKLPNLARLITEGAAGSLQSTIRPESSVAWSSLSTGVNPGKHGIFGFAQSIQDSYGFRLVNANAVNVRRYWDLIGDAGMRISVVNMPMTYPPNPVNGCVVGGMLTPSVDVEFTYPSSLRPMILEKFPDYRIDMGEFDDDKEAFLKAARDYTQQQLELALHLMRENDWRFFGLVFTATDRVQHFLWDVLISDDESQLPSSLPTGILEFYRDLDQAVGKLVSKLSSDTLLLLVSDHGFNGVARRFYVNNWLEENGYLSVDRMGATRTLGWIDWIKRRLGTWSWIRRIKRLVMPDQLSFAYLEAKSIARAINWNETQAYFAMDGGIRVNLKGRDPQGIVDPDKEYDSLLQVLIDDLHTVVDPETQTPVFSRIYRRHELYEGAYVQEAPDLILEPQREHVEPRQNFVLDRSLTSHPTLIGEASPLTGNHALDGIFVAWGTDVVPNYRVEGANLLDIAPTILAYLGLSVPGHYDGRVIDEIFRPQAKPDIHISDFDSLTLSLESDNGDDNQEGSDIVRKRLEELGYLS